MTPDLHDAEREKRQRKSFQRLDDPPELLSKFNISNLKGICNEEPRNESLLIGKRQLKLTEPEKFLTLHFTFLHNTNVSKAN